MELWSFSMSGLGRGRRGRGEHREGEREEWGYVSPNTGTISSGGREGGREGEEKWVNEWRARETCVLSVCERQ